MDVVELRKSYGGPDVVCSVSFSVPQGEFITLLGPSGSGKTTTLMMVAGFEQPSSGDIRIGGRSIVTVPPQRRNLGIVFQNYALFPHMSVVDNVMFPLRMRRIASSQARASAMDMLGKVGLEGFGERLPRQLSGGQQQRVALARALVFEPDVLLLDEPLGALDRRLRESLQVEIKAIQHRLGVSVLFVTHDQEEAMTMSDRVAVMNAGRIVQMGTPADVYRAPADTFVASFLGETNLIPCIVRAREHRGRAIVAYGDGTVGGAHSRTVESGPAVASIRPERMMLLSGDASADNVVDGVVDTVVFAGAWIRYTVRALGMDIVVRCLDSSAPPYARGESVRLGWSADDAQVVLPADAGETDDEEARAAALTPSG
jgi:putative spermidine/putrescine transport system ATP-binding protein